MTAAQGHIGGRSGPVTDRPIFMIGVPRSGTSIISEAFSLHERLGWCSNYLYYFPSAKWVSLLSRLAEVRVLRGKKRQSRDLAAQIRHLLPYAVEATGVFGYYCGEDFLFDYLIGKAATDDVAEDVRNLVEDVLRLQGKQRFFANFTGPPRIDYLKSIFPDAFYIHIVRDPRAVVSSLLNVGFWRDGGGLEKPWWRNGLPEQYEREWIESGRSPAALAAVQWKSIIELTWREKESVGEGRYVEVRYEDFVANPHEVLRDTFDKIGLKDSAAAHGYLDSIGKVRNMNFKYKENLTPEDISVVERLTSDVAGRAGYDF